MHKDICLGSMNKMIYGSKQRMNNRFQVGLQQLGKNRADQNMGIWTFLVTSPILYPCSAQPKDTH
jgi:hypothetical protein